MLHELLLALSGHPGDVFVPHPPPTEQPTTFCVAKDFPFLHPAERAALDRLAVLGYRYKAISDFCCSGIPSAYISTNTATPHGIYFQTLCRAISEALVPYRRAVSDLEKDILSGKAPGDISRPPLSHITATLARHEHPVAFLHSLVGVLQTEHARWHGCRMLDLLHQTVCATGVPESKAVGEDLLWKCQQVFLKQCTNWILYGEINDTAKEFFIIKRDASIPEESKQLLSEANTKTGNHVNSSAKLKSNGIDETSESGTEGGLWQTVYALNESMVPSYIPQRTAESILFVGKAVATLHEAKRRKRDLVFDANGEDLSFDYTTKHIGILSHLSASNCLYSPLEIEYAISRIRRDVSERLWAVVVRGPVLGKHILADLLLSLRRYALIGRGDWAMSLLEAMNRLKVARQHRSASSTIRETELNATLIRASYGTSAENDPTLEHFRLLPTPIPNPNILEAEPAGANHWYDFDTRMLPGTPIRLSWEIRWPLDLLLSARDGDRYARLFAFLIALRRVQIRLQRLGIGGARKRKGRAAAENEKVCSRMWRLRQGMMFCIDGLWSHVQMDVIDGNFQDLYRKLVGPSQPKTSAEHQTPPPLCDLEDIQRAHSIYLDTLEHGCLLSSIVIASAVRDVVDTCEKFCARAERGGESFDMAMQEIDVQYCEKAQFLFRALSGASKSGSNVSSQKNHAQVQAARHRHLDQLLLKWDYSKWFSFTMVTREEGNSMHPQVTDEESSKGYTPLEEEARVGGLVRA